MSKHVPPPTGEPLERLDNLAMAVPPKWGEAILRLAKATERVAEKLDEMPGAADVQYIPKARELAKSLIDFLDGLEDTDQDAAIDDGPCDTDELEIAEGDDEPSLGSTGHGSGGPISYRIPVVSAGGEMIHDCEGDEHDGREDVGDDEPSLGSMERHCSNYGAGNDRTGDQSLWADSPGQDLEDEHDGAEPDDNEGGDGAKEDYEPSLGWTIDGAFGDPQGDDRELQDHVAERPEQHREKLTTAVTIEDRGWTGRKVIRNLSDSQRDALAERLDPHGSISLE
jgi:hypothetical protein